MVKPGRNDLCPCGSGEKYKKCCGRLESGQPNSQLAGNALRDGGTNRTAPTHGEFSQLVSLFNAGRYEELEHQASLLLARFPGSGATWNLLGVALHILGKNALPALQRAGELLPHSADVHNNLGSVLRDMGMTDKAEVSLRRALKINPGYAQAHNNLGGLFIGQGRFAEARESLQKALQIRPDMLEAICSLVDIKKVEAGDDSLAALTAIEERVRSGKMQLTHSDAVLMHFALGKSYDDLGEYDKAFPHFLEGGRLKRGTFSYDPAETERHFAAIARNLDAGTLERLRGSGDPSSVPIFVLGMPRSGTTLTEQIIASHPEVYGAGELQDLMKIARRDIGGATYPDYVRHLDHERLAALGAEYVAGLRRHAPEARHVTDKMPANFMVMGLIRLMLPNAKIIHVRRNPVDTCLSCFTTLFERGQEHTYDLAELGRYYTDYARLMDHWRRVLPEGAFLEVQYEDIVADQEGQARRLIEYCGLEWDDACLDFHRNKRAVRTASMMQVRRPIYKSSVERWRHYEKFLGPLLEALGEHGPERGKIG